MTVYYRSTGINWSWYAGLTDVTDDACTIITYDRLHHDDPYQGAGQHPVSVGSCHMFEDDGRIVRAIEVWPNDGPVRRLTVRNPAHVFSYGRFQRRMAS